MDFFQEKNAACTQEMETEKDSVVNSRSPLMIRSVLDLLVKHQSLIKRLKTQKRFYDEYLFNVQECVR